MVSLLTPINGVVLTLFNGVVLTPVKVDMTPIGVTNVFLQKYIPKLNKKHR